MARAWASGMPGADAERLCRGVGGRHHHAPAVAAPR